MAAKPLRIIPLGGLGEVGKNMTAIEYGENILLIDSGIMFPENDMLGIDYIIPDFNYLLDKKDIVRGLIITHGHEDHTGAITHVLQEINVPVYATRLSHGLIGNKLKRAGMQQDVEAITINAGDKINIGPFEVEFFHVAHSIPDGVGLGITTPAGLIVHSGDFKFDHTPIDGWPTDLAKLAEFGGRGVLALLADSTNADRPGWTPSERMIDSGFDQVFLKARGRILIGTFASLISRMAASWRLAMYSSAYACATSRDSRGSVLVIMMSKMLVRSSCCTSTIEASSEEVGISSGIYTSSPSWRNISFSSYWICRALSTASAMMSVLIISVWVWM